MSEVNRFRLRIKNMKNIKGNHQVVLTVDELLAFISEYDELKEKYDILASMPVTQPTKALPEIVSIHVSGGDF